MKHQHEGAGRYLIKTWGNPKHSNKASQPTPIEGGILAFFSSNVLCFFRFYIFFGPVRAREGDNKREISMRRSLTPLFCFGTEINTPLCLYHTNLHLFFSFFFFFSSGAGILRFLSYSIAPPGEEALGWNWQAGGT